LNAKVTTDPGYIHQALANNPHVDVITTADMDGTFGDDPHVVIDHDVTAADAYDATADSFEAVGDLGHLINKIPFIVLLFSAARNATAFCEGRKSIGVAVEHTLVDTTAAGLGRWVGFH